MILIWWDLKVVEIKIRETINLWMNLMRIFSSFQAPFKTESIFVYYKI